ncbi:dihydrofolate reductase family protein [Novosphingobium lentum]|uniref:dihydrofolate reductase family protein n=1 Tax=Novosphingobium lentum TaxID=145287 RepID=UPI00082DA7AB|nr:dihydrofolate reductase family protein [Novosphingobium lentum]
MSRRIIGGVFVSLDGIIQAPGGPDEDTSGGFPYGGWMEPVSEEVIGSQIGALFAGPFDLLLGRRTYDIFAAYWPFIPTDNPISAKFATVQKYVLTGSDTALDWHGSHCLADLDALAKVKAADGPDLVIQGSSTLYPQLLSHGLLDRLVLMILPVVLGTGKRLFGDGTPAITFKPIEQRMGPRGCMIATLEPAGPVKTGSFGEIEPSAPEHARRAKIAEGTW